MTGDGGDMDTWLWQSASDLGRGIGRGEIDPVALTEAYLDACAGHEHRDRIYTVLTPERARAEAAAAAERARNGVRRGPLDGVPISWKDLFDSAGVATEAGSRLLEGRVPDADAEVLARATRAGLVCLGKTHMSELAFSGLGLNPAYRGTPEGATPPNVHGGNGVPGGSSSGAAASVAFGLAAAGIGSDTGGSVRIPSAFNDLVGLKTTHGRLSNEGVVPLVDSLDTVGPLCRSVEDCAALLAVMEGGAMADLTGASLEGARLLVLQNYTDDVRDVPGAAFATACEKLSAAGAVIEHASLDQPREAIELAAPLVPGEAYGIWRDVIEAAPDRMFDRVRERFRAGGAVSAPDYVAAMRRLKEVRRSWLAETAAYDAVILPSVACLPADIDRLMSDTDYYVSENLLTLRNARIGNMLGLCGLTLPAGVPSTGIMFLAPPMAEERLLRLGTAAEAALA
jgi:aspartyl-tRNA(Asn)/glutamyl-tRNA(Gln) amidotransferase subunit A